MPNETTDLWNAVDEYITGAMVREDEALRAVSAAAAAAGLPLIAVAPNQGKLLYLLARIRGARNALEIGTLAAYSTIWIARGLGPGGRVITLEADPRHAEVARANVVRAGLSGRVDVRLGKALDTLPGVASSAPFDFVFIDADKANIPEYFDWALRLTQPGAVIVVDNVIRDGAVIDASSTDASVLGVRRLNERLRVETRVSATTIQTVGSKGYDGLTIALVNHA
jgi:predicted O-methyltransferase YrrM